MIKGNVAKFCTLCLFLLPMNAWGQNQGYKYTKTGSYGDLTPNALSGTSVWKYINGNPQCKLKSLSQGYDLSTWCVGMNGYPYRFNPQTKAWDEHTEMGTSALFMVVADANHIYSMQIGGCPVFGGAQYYALYKWNGSNAWNDLGGCATKYSLGVDGFMAAAGWDGNTNQAALFSSKDGGSTWTLWADSWTYVNMADTNYGCGIYYTGTIYQIGLNNNAIAEPSLPSGTAAGCIASEGDPVFLAWNTAGTLYLLNTSTGVWQPISGLTVNQVVAVDKADVLALDLTGKPYHWNVFAPGITVTVSGTFDNFPMGSLNPPPQHTSHIKVNFPHGTNTAAASAQTIPYNGAMNNSYTDYAPQCDVFYGDPGSQECVPAVGVDNADCSVAGPLAITPDNNGVGFGLSIDNIEWTGPYNQTAPQLSGNGTTGSWTGVVRNRFQDACGFTGGTPSCQVDGEWNYVADFITGWWINDPTGTVESTVQHNWVLDQMQIDAGGGYSPWSVLEYYVQEGGAPVCMGAHRPIRYNGDYYLQPPCQ